MRYLVRLFLGLLLVAPQLDAQGHQPVGIERPKVVDSWLQRLEAAEEALVAEEWKKARKMTDDVLSEMCARIESGTAVADLLGNATFLRSVAEAGLGNSGAANWDYTAAQTLVPGLSEIDLARFGATGKMLEPWRLTGDSEESAGAEEVEAKLDEAMVQKVTPPKKIRSPRPKYPFGKYQACVDGPIVVQIIIDEEGMPTHPQLMTTQDPLLGFAAMEALRKWRFKPAKLEGEPIEVYYKLTVNFKLPTCRNLFARTKKAESGG